MKKIKIIEESRFLSSGEMRLTKGGAFCSGASGVYKSGNQSGFTICGGYFETGLCVNNYLGCIHYASCFTGASHNSCGETAFEIKIPFVDEFE